MPEQLLHKVQQTADRLQCSPRQVHYLIGDGELEVVHINRAVRVVVASEDAYLERLRQREPRRRAAKAAAKAKALTTTPSAP
jgi:hypothetical protein